MTNDYDDLYGSRFLGSSDLTGPVTATITKVEREAFVRPGEPTRTKAVIYVRNGKKGVVCNKTNAKTLTASFGKSFTGWVGKRIVIRSEPTNFGGKPTTGIRLYPAPNGDDKIESGPVIPPEPPPADHDDMDDEIPF